MTRQQSYSCEQTVRAVVRDPRGTIERARASSAFRRRASADVMADQMVRCSTERTLARSPRALSALDRRDDARSTRGDAAFDPRLTLTARALDLPSTQSVQTFGRKVRVMSRIHERIFCRVDPASGVAASTGWDGGAGGGGRRCELGLGGDAITGRRRHGEFRRDRAAETGRNMREGIDRPDAGDRRMVEATTRRQGDERLTVRLFVYARRKPPWRLRTLSEARASCALTVFRSTSFNRTPFASRRPSRFFCSARSDSRTWTSVFASRAAVT